MNIWKQNEIDNLIELIKKGKSYKEISFELGRESSSIRTKLYRLGYKSTDFIKTEINHCLNCNKEISNKKLFCNHSCSATYNNKIRFKNEYQKNNCLNCNKEIKIKKNYCSNKCQGEHKQNLIFEKIENGDITFSEKSYKKFLIKKYGDKCMKCGWNEINPVTGKVPIQLEHIDGNSENNTLENLMLLCPNHHSLTPTYGALNKGHGRKYRYKK